MTPPNSAVDPYFAIGCGRCALVNTPDCKAVKWSVPLRQLREIALAGPLREELKWSQPCYTYNGNNVMLIYALKDHFGVSFFKGAALTDPDGVLRAPGKHSRFDRQIKLSDPAEVPEMAAVILKYIDEAVQLEEMGVQVEVPKSELEIPVELQEQLDREPEFREAWDALTPGRKRGYCIYIAGAKQATTRANRVEKWRLRIMAGKGMQDR